MAQEEQTYNMSFTAGALMVNETHAVAEAFLECDHDWKLTREKVFRENIMAKEKQKSSERYLSLMKQRIETLNEMELRVLIDGNMMEKRQIILLTICKAYPFIFDFIREAVGECFYGMQQRITQATFNGFFNEKKYTHPELETITDNTIYKMKQVTFHILEQAELIESAETGEIRRPYLSEKMERLIVQDNPAWLAAFLYSNNEISNLAELYG